MPVPVVDDEARATKSRTFFLDHEGIQEGDVAATGEHAVQLEPLGAEPKIHALVAGWPWVAGVPSLLLPESRERIFWLEGAAAGADLIGNH